MKLFEEIERVVVVETFCLWTMEHIAGRPLDADAGILKRVSNNTLGSCNYR
jgi:hypothetical protein